MAGLVGGDAVAGGGEARRPAEVVEEGAELTVTATVVAVPPGGAVRAGRFSSTAQTPHRASTSPRRLLRGLV